MHPEGGDRTDALAGQRAYKEGRFADAARHLASASLGAPTDMALRLMLARACERMDWKDLAWALFQGVSREAHDDASRNLAKQGMESLPAPPSSIAMTLIITRQLDPVWLARARGEARNGESPLTWLVRQDVLPFDRMVAGVLGGKPAGFARSIRDRLGMRLLGDRKISQGDLKKALAIQAADHRPLGAILVKDLGLSSAVLESYLKAQAPLAVSLGPSDAPQALLIRWGALRPEDWEGVKFHGAKAFEILVTQKRLLGANLRRADAYRQAKLKLLKENRFRLGEILVSDGVLDAETLAKALAWQVDQPYPLGELLIRHRLASPESVLEALLEQAKRYDEAAERDLPPVEFPVPAPPPDEEGAPPSNRRTWVIAGAAALVLMSALVFANRYSRGDFAFLSSFDREGKPREAVTVGAAQLLGGSQASGPRRERGTAFDPLDLPDSEFSSRALADSQGGGMVGAPSGGGFIGNRQSDGFVGAPLPGDRVGGDLSQTAGETAVGTPLKAEAVGSSGVKDSVRYAKQASSGAQRSKTSREAELMAIERTAYPQARPAVAATMVGTPEGGRMQQAVSAGGQLQAPVALGGTINGSPAEGIQVRRDTAIFRLRLGRSLFDRQDEASAREEFLSAIGLDPTLSPPHYFLGRIAEARGDREVALKWYRSYLTRTTEGEYASEVQERIDQLAN